VPEWITTKEMDNKQFGKELENRTKDFALRIIHLATRLPNMPEARVVRTQLTRSGTSIGANYREANRARSRADFQNKISICEAEASETQYWLEIIMGAQWLTREDLKTEYEESGELLAIFTSIGSN
jgi:four helix bundle protein